MNQLTEEQRERVGRIKKRVGTTYLGIAREDFDFLFSLLDDQAVRVRDACAGRVRQYLTDCRDEERGIVEAIASELESLTIPTQ